MCGDTQDLQLIPREPGHETRVDDPEQVQLVHPADTRLQLVIPLEPPEVIADYQAHQPIQLAKQRLKSIAKRCVATCKKVVLKSAPSHQDISKHL